jgi:hypothetical protein
MNSVISVASQYQSLFFREAKRQVERCLDLMSHQRYALTAISSYGEKFAIAGKKKLRNV